MKKSILSALALAVLLPMGAFADKIPAQEATSIAKQFVINREAASGIRKAPAADLQLTLAAETDGHYIFNVNGNGGYVVVAADDVASSAVLGYADEGNISTRNMPENMRWWLSEYDRQIEYARQNGHGNQTGAALRQAAIQKAQGKYKQVGPLLTCNWGQDEPYNMYCPTDGGTICPSGCVATAAAQILYYHKWPDAMEGSHSGTDFSTVTYDWSLMRDSYRGYASQASKEEVAKLMRNLGIATDMQYAASGSGTYSTLLRTALINYFKCSDARLLQRGSMTTTAWLDAIYDELSRMRPVYFSAYTASYSGHAFVCDGINNGYLHINWGWDGLANGYFLADAMEPAVQGTGGAIGAFNYGQMIITGIYNPNIETNKFMQATYRDSNLKLDKTTVGRDEALTISGTLRIATNESSFAMGLKVVDSLGNVAYITAGDTLQNVGKTSTNAVSKFSVSMKDFPSAKGTYYVYPVAYGCDSKSWYSVIATRNVFLCMTAEAGTDSVTFTDGIDAVVSATALQAPDEVYTEEETDFSTTLSCKAGDFNGRLFVGFRQDTTVVWSEAADSPFSIPEGTDIESTLRVMTPYSVGTYAIAVYKEVSGQKVRISDEKTITIAEKQPELYIYSAMTIDNYENLAPEDFRLVVYMRCLNKAYSGEVGLAIADNETGEIVERMTKSISLNINSIGHYTFSGKLQNVVAGKIYNAKIYSIGADESWNLVRSKEGAQGPVNNKLFRITTDTNGIMGINADSGNGGEAEIFAPDGSLIMRTGDAAGAISALPAGLYIIKTGNSTAKIHK